MEVLSLISQQLPNITLHEPIMSQPKRKRGRPALKVDNKKEYAKKYYTDYYKNKYAVIRRICYLQDHYHIHNDIIQLPQSTTEEAHIKVNVMEAYVDNLKRLVYKYYTVQPTPLMSCEYSSENDIELNELINSDTDQ